ncbi:MAG: S-layer homology domain-containing protein [Selenomonadaceae bacterium]|nr:S-layer homology domain-containing protein [Selenomonadaceae bacterium]
MQNKKLALAVLSAFVFSSSTAFAASGDQLFKDVPSDHWAYQAVTQLAKDGILTGYGDESFQGDKTITRYEMAQIVANARTHLPQASAPDQKIIDDLSNEFRDDLDALGVRVTRLEKKQKTVRLTGSIGQEYQKSHHEGIAGSDNDEHSRRWRKEIKLNLDAMVPKTPITFHSTFTTQLDSTKGNGFNSEEASDEDWNNSHSRSNVMRPETAYVSGPIDKTGLDGAFGLLYNGVQNEFVNHAAMKGFQVSKQGKKNWFSVFTGRLDIKDSDTSIYATQGAAKYTDIVEDWSTKYPVDLATGKVAWDKPEDYSSMQKDSAGLTVFASKSKSYTAPSSASGYTTDFVRAYNSSGSTGTVNYADDTYGPYFIEHQDWGGATASEYTETFDASKSGSVTEHKTLNRRRTLTGATFGHQFGSHLDATLGYYGYKSAAYDENVLRIYALTINQKLGKKGNLYGAYAHGNQDGYDNAWTAEYQFNGGDAMPAEPNHAFAYYLGYRYLAPDALVKTVYEDGAEVGQRGWEGGLLYNFCHNLQGKVKYFYGSSITNPGKDRSKVFSSVTFNF